MKVNAAGLILLAASAVASPLAARVARRNGVSRPNIRVNPKDGQIDSTSVSYNWAGAVLESSDFTEVSGTFVVPTPHIPGNGDDSSQYCATAWIGIDGDKCQRSLFQTGVDFCIQGDTVSYDAWYEWIPAASIDFNGIKINAGDSISLSVVATSTTSGVATITNNSNGQRVSHTLTSRQTTSTLCETDAEWIVEDFTIVYSDGSEALAPFANFGTVTFTDAFATRGGSQVNVAGATTITLLDENNKALTTTSASGSTVSVRYIGP